MTIIRTKYTSEQQAAIEARKVSVALSAGAGCGKTFVLTERFLSHLEPGDDDAPPADRLHHLIAITFTDRAAREMRDRIRSKCYERLQAAPPSQADYWLRLLRSLDMARVSTIHAFCGALLRAHAVEAQLDPHFVVIEQTQSETLLSELIEDLLREKLSDIEGPLHEAILKLTTDFGLERLQSMTAELLSSGRAIDFDAWLSRTSKEVVAIWDRFRRETVLPTILNKFARSPVASALIDMAGRLCDASGTLGQRCTALAMLLPALASSTNPAADLDSIIENAKVQGAGGKSTWPDETLYDPFKEAAETVRKDAKSVKAFTEFDAATAEEDAEAGLQLLALAKEVSDRYEARKRELAWIDFNDLLVQAHQLLTDPAHAELQQRLASQVRLLLVDECQDTDPVQVELIQALCGQLRSTGAGRSENAKLFFVGDYKQSIYRFRGADPDVFHSMQEATPKAGRLPLTKNFRSQPAILDFVNALFCEVLAAGADPSLAYQPLFADRPQTTQTPAVEFLWATVKDMKKTQAGAKEAARRKDAEYVARRIRGMLDRREPLVAVKQTEEASGDSVDKSNVTGWKTRPVELKDIAILFRTLSDVQFYEESLRQYGIDYYLVGGHAFYAQQEIFDVVNLLRTLASPADQFSLAGALRSPMFALDDETLFWLAQHPQGLATGLFANKLPAELSAAQRSRAEFAATTLKHLRQSKDRLPIVGLLIEALKLTGYDAVLLGEFMGQRKLANLRKLLEQARAFDQSGALGLADFIVQLSDFVVNQPREPLAATHPEGTNVVRLMTIHQAKGLEFPAVFLPDVNRALRGNDQAAVWHPRLGPLVKVPGRDAAQHKCGLDLHAAVAKAEDQAERMRLFYVATTRAADYLVLSSGLFEDEFESPPAPWTKLLAERFNLKTGAFLGALPQGQDYEKPETKVTMDQPPCDRPTNAQTRHDLDKLLSEAMALAESPKLQSATDDIHGRLAEPIAVDAEARRRFSVSRLSGHIESMEETAEGNVSFGDDELSGPTTSTATDLGSLVHQTLSRVSFGSDVDAKLLIVRLNTSRSGKQDEMIDQAAELVDRFLHSDRARQIAAALNINRELEFLLKWPPASDAKNVDAGAAASGRYLQGFIDCLYQDAAGRWHLIDYKTNQVSAANISAVAAQYEMQLGVYALAVEEILGKSPMEIAVHFLRPSLEHQFNWNSEMRARIIGQVNHAMSAAVVLNDER